jgi:ferritin-like metal-binding protein YciE
VSDRLSSPSDLFLHLLAEMLWVERMLVFEALPSLHKQVQSESLAAAVEEHLAQTRGHVTRVEEAFRALGAEPVSARSAPAAALAAEHEEMAGKIAEPRLADLFHAGAAITTEHFEIASYDVLLELAPEAVQATLAQNREEEAQALKQLRELAHRLRSEVPGLSR